MSRFNSALFICCLLSVACCKNEYVQGDPVCFERDVYPIVASNCTYSGCHNAIDREKGRDYSTYEGIMRDVRAGNYKGSEFYSVLVKSGGEEAMPPKPYSRLSDDQIRTIATWIEEGATNDSCVALVACDTAGTISYTTQVKPLIISRCNSCHEGAALSGGGINLSSHAGLKSSALDGSLMGSVLHQSGFSAMPQNSNKLSNCNLAVLQKWVNAGAPNN
jgi:cytochrome c553